MFSKGSLTNSAFSSASPMISHRLRGESDVFPLKNIFGLVGDLLGFKGI